MMSFYYETASLISRSHISKPDVQADAARGDAGNMAPRVVAPKTYCSNQPSGSSIDGRAVRRYTYNRGFIPRLLAKDPIAGVTPSYQDPSDSMSLSVSRNVRTRCETGRQAVGLSTTRLEKWPGRRWCESTSVSVRR